jgi:hypothetical protein
MKLFCKRKIAELPGAMLVFGIMNGLADGGMNQ